MIVSHKHKFIFIKTNKTAGTSLEIALSAICGKHDIITPISRPDEVVRFQLTGKRPQNFNYANLAFRAHSKAKEVKAFLGDEIWEDYFKFSIERNPWDKAISHYYWQSRNANYPKFQDYINAGELDRIKAFDWYSDEGKVIVDEVFRMEEFDFLLSFLTKKLGLKTLISMPSYRAKSQYRTNRDSPSQFLNASQIELIREKFNREIQLMNYSLK